MARRIRHRKHDPKPARRDNVLGALVLVFAWACLVAAAVLAMAAVAGAQELDRSGAPTPEITPQGPEADGGEVGSGEPSPLTVRPRPVALADVEWAGLLWGSDDGYLPAHLLSAEVDLRVTGFVARARVTQRFANPGDAWLEGVYVFPLPEDAAVDRMRLVVGDRVLEGLIREKEESRRTYEKAKEEGFKASLVEQHRPNVFTTRVANVGPGEAVEVVIELQQPVRYDQGELSLRFPTVVNPRFFPVPGAPGAATLAPALTAAAQPLPPGATGPNAAPATPATAPASAAGHLARGVVRAVEDGVGGYATLARRPAEPRDRQPVAAPGAGDRTAAGGVHSGGVHPGTSHPGTSHPGVPLAGSGAPHPASAGPANPVAFAVTLDAGFPLDYLDCPYHRVDVEPLGDGRFRVRLAGGPASADRDFELVWAPRVDAEPRTALFTEEHGGDTYSLLMVLPPEAGASGWVPLDREMVFIVDVSGSMHGAALEQAKAALAAVLDGLGPRDSFNVIAFSDDAQPLFPDSLDATPEALAKARRWVAALESDGGTNMLPALAAALDAPEGYGTRGRRTLKQVVFLTDGAVGNEAELFDYVARHLGDVRLFTVGIGPAPNGHFMQRAAEEGRGTYTFIGDPREVAFKVEKLVRKLEGPVLTDLEVRWPGGAAEVWPRRLPDLYAGEPLVVAARTPGEGIAGTVEVVGRRGGVLWEQEVGLTDPVTRAVAEATGFATAVAGGGVVPSADGPGRGVRQLWAKRKIASLMATLASGADRDTVRRAVLDTALHHHLVSPFTSLVAVDVTPSRPAGEGLQGRRVPGATPAGWTPPGTLPMGGTGWQLHLAAGLALLLAALALMGGTSRSGRRFLAAASRRARHAGAAFVAAASRFTGIRRRRSTAAEEAG